VNITVRSGRSSDVNCSIQWDGVENAGGYRIWSRNVNMAGSELVVAANVTDQTCAEDFFLFPGVWNYAFAMSSFNGDEESAVGAEVVAPSPAPSVTEGSRTATCAPLPPWCPGGGAVSVPPQFSNPTTSFIGGPTTSAAAIPTGVPVVDNGQCTGPDCVGGQCTGMRHGYKC
jgi:hypothetical protein